MGGMSALQEQVEKITSLDLCRQWSSCTDSRLWEPRWWSGNSSQGCPSGRLPWRDPVCRRRYMHMYARLVQQRCIHAKQANPLRCGERNCTSLWKSGEAVDFMLGWLLCGLITGKHYKNMCNICSAVYSANTVRCSDDGVSDWINVIMATHR